MLKENSGITMISLVVTVIVLMILASISTYSGLKTAKDAKYYNAINQMKVMQAQVNNWYEEKKDGNEEFWNKGIALGASGKETQCIRAYNAAKENNKTGSSVGDLVRI